MLGGGFAGLLAAMVLTRHAEHVTVVESGWYPDGPQARPGIPQGHHSHVLVAGGASALEALLPGTVAELLARGAHRRGLPSGALIRSAEGWFPRHETGAYLIACSRWLIDDVVRRRALAGGAMALRERTRALGLTGDASRVTGVVVRGEGASLPETVPADVVVDATGRGSSAHRWLVELAARPVEEELLDPGLAYSTRVYQAPAALAASIPAIMLHPGPAADRPGQGATLFPIEGDRWIVTLTGARADAPPTDEEGFTACTRSLGCPILAELVAAASPVGGVRPYRGTVNRRRFFERIPLPDGFLAVGDALVAVNPIHSHGMSVAALSALRLAGELDRRGADPAVFPRLQAAMAAEAERSWVMATSSERRRGGGCTGSGTGRVMVGNPLLATQLFRAQALMPPAVGTRSAVLTDAPPPRTADEAVAQYLELSQWWVSERRHRAGLPV